MTLEEAQKLLAEKAAREATENTAVTVTDPATVITPDPESLPDAATAIADGGAIMPALMTGGDIETATSHFIAVTDRAEAVQVAARRLCDDFVNFFDNKEHMRARVEELRAALAL